VGAHAQQKQADEQALWNRLAVRNKSTFQISARAAGLLGQGKMSFKLEVT
jgi:hypothetical protein